MTTNSEIKNFIWYCPVCGAKFDNQKLEFSKNPNIDFFRKCNKCFKYFDIDNKEIKNYERNNLL
jgi:hypothetical protein